MATSNRNIAVADIAAVECIGLHRHLGPGVTTSPVGAKRLRGCCRIFSLFVDRIEKSCPEEVSVVKAKAIDDKNVIFDLAEFRRCRSRVATSASSRERAI